MTERGKWVPERLAERIFNPGETIKVREGELVLSNERLAALYEFSAIPLTDAPDPERAELEQAFIQYARNALRNPGLVAENAAIIALNALDAHIAKTAKPKREEGKWYAGKHRNYRGPSPWLFIDGHLRERATGIGYEEYDFDWISDTPLDLGRKE